MSFLNLIFPKTLRLLQPIGFLTEKKDLNFSSFFAGLQIKLNESGLYIVLQPIPKGEVLWMDACTVEQSEHDRQVAIKALDGRGMEIRNAENLLWHSTFNDEPRNFGYYRVPDQTAKLNYLWRPSSCDGNGKKRNVNLFFIDNCNPSKNDQTEFSCLLVAQANVALVKGDILCGPHPDDGKSYPGSIIERVDDLPIDQRTKRVKRR